MTLRIESQLARLAAYMDVYRARLFLLDSRLVALQREGVDIQRLRVRLRASAEAVGKLRVIAGNRTKTF
jgi:hypothetical protein